MVTWMGDHPVDFKIIETAMCTQSEIGTKVTLQVQVIATLIVH